MILLLFNMNESLLTWCHRTPAETPTSPCKTAIRVEDDLHSVAPGRYDWRQEVIERRWISIRVAAAVVHQGRPVPIGDSDKVGGAGGDTAINIDGKGGEFKPQYISSVHLHVFSLVKIMRIVSRMVW